MKAMASSTLSCHFSPSIHTQTMTSEILSKYPQVASRVDFGFVPTKEQVKHALVVKNTGDLEVRQHCFL